MLFTKEKDLFFLFQKKAFNAQKNTNQAQE